jgi:hypothetical protein
VEAVKALGGVDVSLTVVAAKLQLDKNPTHHRVRKAIERGFLVNNEPAKGRPLKLAIGDPIPDATEILPDINTLRSCCTVVVDPGGERRKTAEVAKVGPTCEAGAHLLLPPTIHHNTTTAPRPTSAASSPTEKTQPRFALSVARPIPVPSCMSWP